MSEVRAHYPTIGGKEGDLKGEIDLGKGKIGGKQQKMKMKGERRVVGGEGEEMV